MPVGRTSTVGFRVYLWSLLILACLALAPVRAATEPGTEIRNVASLSYIDSETGDVVEVQSNPASVVVVELYRFTLRTPGELSALPGDRVLFVHQLENTGNADDRYELALLNALDDDADLFDLQLVLDENGNGVVDEGEPVLGDPLALAAGESISLIVAGRVSPDADAEDRIDVILSARSTSDVLAVQENRDTITVLATADLRLSLSNSPECSLAVEPGSRIEYRLEARNTSDTRPVARVIEVDGVERRGVLLEIELPEPLRLDAEADAEVMAFQAILLVQGRARGDAWMRLSAWDGRTRVHRLGLLVPEERFSQDEVLSLEFAARVPEAAEPLTVTVQAGVDLDADDTFEFESNTVCNTIITLGSGNPDLEAAMRFVEPTLALRRAREAPDFRRDADFVDAEVYRLALEADALSTRRRSAYRLVRDGVYLEMAAEPSESVVLRNSADVRHVWITLQSQKTADSLQVLLRETGEGSQRWRVLQPILLHDTLSGDGGSCPPDPSVGLEQAPDYLGESDVCVLQSDFNDRLRAEFVDPLSDAAVADSAGVDPTGRVFDSTTLEGVADAEIRVLEGDAVALDPLTDEAVQLTSDKFGRYLLPRLTEGIDYHIDVGPPPSHVFPSIVPPGRFDDLSVSALSYGRDGFDGQGDGRFRVEAGESAPVIDIPLDPVNRDVLLVAEKSASVESVEPGDYVSYRIQLSNASESRLRSVDVLDTPPYGFRYQRGSATLDGEPIADPEVLRLGGGQEVSTAGERLNSLVTGLMFGIDGIESASSVELGYRLQATAGAIDGDGINTMVASAETESGVLVSASPSRARVSVARTGVLSDRALLFGKVYVDSSCDHVQNQAEWPVGGVRLYLEDGTFVVTDEDGQFSLYGLEPGSHVLKLDSLSLPEGLELKPTDVRHGADPESRFVDLSPGDFHRADFATLCPAEDADAVFEQLAERNRDLRGTWLLDEASRYDPDGENPHLSDKALADIDGDLSSGLLGEPRLETGKGDRDDASDSLEGAAADALGTQANGIDASRLLTLPDRPLITTDATAPPVRAELPDLLGSASDESVAIPLLHSTDSSLRPSPPGSVVGTDLHAPFEAGDLRGDGDTASSEGYASADADRATGLLAGSRKEKRMGDPKELASTITAAQAAEGTWLWPRGDFSSDGRFMAVVRAGLEPVLHVNGLAVPDTQIGERIVNRREGAQIVAWYGVSLAPGINQMEVRGADSFGNERVLASGAFKRPSAGTRMILRTREDTLAADGGRSSLPIDIVINDKNGYPASGVYFVTLNTTGGEFLEQDLQRREPGLQVRVEEGRGKVHLRSSETTGRVRVSATSGGLDARLNIVQIAAVRPMIGSGLVSLGANWQSADRGTDERADIESGFDTSARMAFFLKGRVRRDMSLTLSYDTDKNRDDDLLRDIDPRDQYPTHGDSSIRGFEAQSRSKLYAKLERNRSSVMWGDYLTDSQSDIDDLARVQRTLTGFNGVYDNARTRVQAFAARQSEVRSTEEIRGNGTAMLFRLQGAPIVANSEVIELIVRDRDNVGLVIDSRRLQRFIDYTLDPITGLLSFSDSIPSVTDALNPVFLRISYDRRGELEEHTVAGLRLEHVLGSSTRVGLSHTEDHNRVSGFDLTGVTASTVLASNTTLSAAVANMRHRDGRDPGAGVRLQLEHDWQGERDFRTLMSYARAAQGFDNPGAGIAAGREEWRVEHRQPLGNTLKATALALSSRSLIDDTGFGSAGVVLSKNLVDWTLSGGLRHIWSHDALEQLRFNTVLLGAERRLSFAGGRQASIGVDYERDLTDAGRYRYGVDARALLHQHVTLYGRYERENGLSSQSVIGAQEGRSQFVLGLESDVLPSTEVFSEYRMRGAFTGRSMEAASGLRGRYEIEPELTVSPSLEVIDALGGDDTEDSVAVSVGASDTRNPNRKVSAQLEAREADSSRYLGARATLAQRLDVDWTALVREEFTRQVPDVGEMTLRHRFTLGLARRPKLDNRHHLLFLASWNEDYAPEDGEDRRTWLLSTHQNRELSEATVINGRVGAKWQRTRFDAGSISSRLFLTDLRLTHEMRRRWELDLRAGWLATHRLSNHRFSAGAGVWWLADRNLRLGLGYNLVGFRDEDLDEQGYNAQGLRLGLELKFDEDWFRWLED